MSSLVTKIEQLDPRIDSSLVEPGTLLTDILVKHELVDLAPAGFVRKTPFILSIDGEWLLEKDWPLVMPDNKTIVIERLAGGGGGGGGSKGLGVIMAVVGLVAAPFTGGYSLLLLLPAASMLLTGPVAVPKGLTNSATGKDTVSPTYSMGTNLNSARLYSAIPRLYGRMKIIPDLASTSYTEFEGNDQYLYQLLVISQGDADVEQIYVGGSTPLEAFSGVQTQVIRPYERVTLFPDNVVLSSSVDNILLNNAGTPAGPFVSTAVGTKTVRIGIDLHWPGGCYNVDPQNGNIIASSMQVQVIVTPVNDSGNPTGAPIPLISQQFTFATQQAQRVTLGGDVPEGRYSVQVLRAGQSKLNDSKIQNDCYWVGLKSYVSGSGNYGNVTLLAIKIKATEALNSSTAREFSVIACGKVPTWNPLTGWSDDTVKTQSIAWAAADILMNTSYGAGMGNTRVDLMALYNLDQIWKARKDTFNGYFDNTAPLWDALSKVLRAGRAAPMYYAGRVEFIRDAEQSIAKLVLNPKDILPGSMEITYNWPTEKSPDHVIIQYTDERTWTPAEIVCALPGSPRLVPAVVDMFGVTNRNQGFNEGITLAASNRYRRADIRFTALLKGLIPRYNSLVSVSHDVAAWGFSGVIFSLNRSTGQLRTSEPLPFNTTSSAIAFQKKDGSQDGPYNIRPDETLQDGEYGGVVVPGPGQSLANIYVSDGLKADRSAYQFGPTGRTALKILVTKCTPRGTGQFAIEGVNYTEAVFIAETGQPIPPPLPPSSLIDPPVGPIIDRVVVTETTTPNKQICSFTPAIGATYYQIQHRLPTGTWADVYSSILNTSVEVNLAGGLQSVRVRAVGTFAGPWATWTGQVLGGLLDLPEIASFTATPNFLNIYLAWDFTEDTRLIVDYVNIYASEDPIPSPTTTKLIGQFKFPTNTYIAPVGVPGRTVYFWIRAIDRAGREGPFFQAGTPITGETTSDPEVLLQLLTNSIGASQLTIEMRQTIDSIIESGADMKSAFEAFQGTYNTDKETIAQNFVTLQSQLSDSATAITQQLSETKANIDGTLSATITMRAQVNNNGKLVTAGIGIGVTPDPDDPTQYNSELIFMARRVAFIGDNIDGPLVAPLVIEGENVFMHGAFMVDATITNAKIGTAAVTSLKVAGNAITIPLFMKRNENNIPGGELAGFLITLDEETPVLIWAYIGMSYTINNSNTNTVGLDLQVDGASIDSNFWQGQVPPVSFNFTQMKTLPAGNHTILITGSIGAAGGNTIAFSKPSILVLGVKR